MLKIWGRPWSTNVRKVVLDAQWLGIPFERVDAGHEFGVVTTPEYLAMRVAPGKRQAQLVERSISATEPLLRLLDAHLAGQAFMAGDAFTMADIPIACEVHRWRALPVAQIRLPHVDRRYAGIRARDDAARGVLDLVLS